MSIENKNTDIFTEYNDSIFSEGSLDPMGLRIIWTALGNAIFENRLNTVSTDIRYYTINLLHHYVIWRCQSEKKDEVIRLVGTDPYFLENDLYEGIVIFLENLLTQVMERSDDTKISVPALAKFKSLKDVNANDEKVTHLWVDKHKGVLVRQIGLGIHGRQKGPFQQMGLFGMRHYYDNDAPWEKTGRLFESNGGWSSLINQLIAIVERNVLSQVKGRTISCKAMDLITPELIATYTRALQPEMFKSSDVVKFWEYNLGLDNGDAALLYDEVKQMPEKSEYRTCILNASTRESSGKIKAIIAIEPLLACIDKSMDRLLQRGNTRIDDALIADMSIYVLAYHIDFSEVKKYMQEKYISGAALFRLEKLYDILLKARTTKDVKTYITDLIDYHKRLMEERNNLSWISRGDNHLTQHKSFIYSQKDINEMKGETWRNTYYLSTVLSLYKGLYQ